MMSPDSFVWFQMTRAQDLPKKNRRSSDGEKRRGRQRLTQRCLECQPKEFGLYPEGSEEPGRKGHDHCGTELFHLQAALAGDSRSRSQVNSCLSFQLAIFPLQTEIIVSQKYLKENYHHDTIYKNENAIKMPGKAGLSDLNTPHNLQSWQRLQGSRSNLENILEISYGQGRKLYRPISSLNIPEIRLFSLCSHIS